MSVPVNSSGSLGDAPFEAARVPTPPDVSTLDVHVMVFAYPTSVNVRVELPLAKFTMMGHGHAEWIPGDPNVPDVGNRIAVSRALRDLADELAFSAGNDLSGYRSSLRDTRDAPQRDAPGSVGSTHR